MNSLIYPKFDWTSHLNQISTFFIALLTVAYVLTTSRQLKVTELQLEQMEKTRNLTSQPLPSLSVSKISLEAPRLYYTPPSNEYSLKNRLHVEIQLKNNGQHPATNIVVSAQIHFLTESEKNIMLEATSIQTDILPPNGEFPSTEREKDSFMFLPKENDSDLCDHLRNFTLGKEPMVAFQTIFKNILGACFRTLTYFKIYIPNDDVDEAIKRWHSLIISFPVEYKEEINNLGKLRDKNYDKWDELFQELKEEIQEKIGDVKSVDLDSVITPNSFTVEQLSKEKYDKISSNVSFSRRIPINFQGCSK